MTDQALASQPFIENPAAAEDAVTGLLQQAQEAHLTPPCTDARVEAISLLAMTAGLGTSILVGQRSPQSAAAVLEHHVDRIFQGGGRNSTSSTASLRSAADPTP